MTIAGFSQPVIQWGKQFGGSGSEDVHLEGGDSYKHTSDGGYIMAGRSNSNDGDVTGNHGGFLDFKTFF